MALLPVAASLWSRKNKTTRLGTGGINVASQLGKRYRCGKCGTEALCTKAGEGKLTCCGQEMEVQEAKAIPSSD